MLNAINYGSGLNLHMATDIVIYHELDIELETQVIGRAQRLGRTEPLNVYYLQNDNEKVNCKNPTLNLDIFADDTTMLEKFICGDKNDKKNKIDLGKEIDSDYDSDNQIPKIEEITVVAKSKGRKTKAKTEVDTTKTDKTEVAKAKKTTKKNKTIMNIEMIPRLCRRFRLLKFFISHSILWQPLIYHLNFA